MRQGLATLLIVAILFGGTYWYSVARAICNVPIAYRIGGIDERFGISYEEVRNAASVAESMWEDATGRNLFTYDEDAELSINFIFDERQQTANEEEDLRETLEAKENVSDTVRNQYETLLNEYDELKSRYETRTSAYEVRLAAYNKEVNEWNEKNGAPKDVYERLTATQAELAREQEKLNAIADELNTLVRKMNAVSAKGNSLITDYNQVVEEYNSRFTEGHEFTQGDYEGEVINIYQYDSREELEIVLAHEFGHALSLEHVDGSESIMYHLMDSQTQEIGITAADLTELTRVCGDGSFTGRMMSVARERLLVRE